MTAVRDVGVLDREVGLRLRRAMDAAGINGRRMARLLGQSESRISRWVSGRTSVSAVDAAAFLVVCGVIGHRQDAVLRLVRERATSSVVRLAGDDRWTGYRDHVGTAACVTEFACLELPWMVRTADYARAVGEPPGGAPDPAGLLVSWSAPRLRLLLHEWVVRTPVGGPAVLAAQLDHLVRLSHWRNVSIRVVPIDAPAPVPFGVAEFADRRPAVYRHDGDALVVWDEPAEVAARTATLDRLARTALDEDRSRALLGRPAPLSRA